MYEHVSIEVENGIAVLTLDRPEVYNAFDEQMIDELNDALDSVAADDDAYSLVLTGAGDGFCTGADVNTMPDWADQSKDRYAEFLRRVQRVVRRLRELTKPSAAAINGPAIGAGCDFALACDVRYIDSEAYVSEGFVNVGLVPGDGGAYMLPKLIGESKAREYLLTGKKVDAEEAEAVGLVSESADDALEAAMSFARRVTNRPATAVRRTNQLVGHDTTFEEHCEYAIDYQWECVNDPEHQEAVAAAREGRDPEYDR